MVYEPESAELLQRLARKHVAQQECDGFLVLDSVFRTKEVPCCKKKLERLRSNTTLRGTGSVITKPGSGETPAESTFQRLLRVQCAQQ